MGHQQERHTWNAPRKHLSTRRTRCRANLEDHTLQVSNRLACCSLACLNSCNNIPATSEDQGNKDTHKVTRHCGEHEQPHRRDPALSKHRGTKSVRCTLAIQGRQRDGDLQCKRDGETGTGRHIADTRVSTGADRQEKSGNTRTEARDQLQLHDRAYP